MSVPLIYLTATPLLLFLGFASLPAAERPVQVEAASFGVLPDSGKDATEGIRAALTACRNSGARRLVFAKGIYDLWPDRAAEKYLYVSNNDHGLRRIAFPLDAMENLEIDGSGSSFIFHGPMVPFLLDQSKHIIVRNLAFDFVRPFHSEGRVLAVDKASVDLEFTSEFPYEIRKGVLLFTSGAKKSGPDTTVRSGEVIYPYGSLLSFDPKLRETAYMATDIYGLGGGIHAEALAPQQIRMHLPKVHTRVGDTLVFGAAFRDHPGFVINESADVRLDRVAINHCGGMGVIAQRSADLVLDHVQVTTAPGGKRLVSITADATHFVNCTGKIEMNGCLFETQKDDATNIHGLYARITRILAPDKIEVRLVHPQQAGIDFIRPGTRLELTRSASLTNVGLAVAAQVERLNNELTIVTTKEPLPPGIVVSDCVADADANTADVLIKDCVIRGNRARGILLGSRGKTVVEGNTFHVPGAAILFEGDGRYWYEQAGVTSAVIRRNTFDTCNFGVWGKACIEVGAGIEVSERKTSRYNHDITIEDNLFRVFSDKPLVYAYSVDGLAFHGNRLERTTAYGITANSAAKLFDITDCDRVAVDTPSEVVVPAAAK